MLPPKSHPRWKELVCGKLPKISFAFLATKFFITRVTGVARNDPSPETISSLIDESYAFFQKNERLVEIDIVAIFGQEYKK
ncbi:MAG: hypothetical protein P4M00_20410 [Azospirillaceae bacterium]|nr:hypothetical protein [Azospirillaceae bacterium]